jgi:hypothetical protein
MNPDHEEANLEEFLGLLSELRGVVELRVWTGDTESWIGLRMGPQRPAHVLLEQVGRAAVGFGLDARQIHFGILAD